MTAKMWTDEMRRALARGVESGRSFKEIACDLGVSRNAAIGKWARMRAIAHTKFDPDYSDGFFRRPGSRLCANRARWRTTLFMRRRGEDFDAMVASGDLIPVAAHELALRGQL